MRTLVQFRRPGLILALLAGLAACSKSKGHEVTWDDVDRPAAVDQNRAAASGLTAPPMFAHIPADTPYVFAAFVPIPGAYWKRTCEELCPPLEKVIAEAAAEADKSSGSDARLAAAVLGELRGNLSADGFRRLGLSAEPRFAIYGLGPLPVIRVEIADGAALAATMARIEQKAGLSLPTRTAGAQKYWYGGDSDGAVAAGIVGKELVVTVGPTRAVDRAVAYLFGGEKLPGATMADGAALKKLAADYGFAGYGLGYVDFRQLAAAYRGAPGVHGEMWKLSSDDAPGKDASAAVPPAATRADPGAPAPDQDPPTAMRPPDPDPLPVDLDAGVAVVAAADAGVVAPPRDPAICAAALDKLTARFPRFVLGYDEISDKRAAFSATVETDAATAKQLKAMETRSPGVTTRLPDSPLFAFGGAVDVKAARTFLSEMGKVWNDTAAACGLGDPSDSDSDSDDDEDFDLDLPGGVSADSVRGALFVLQGGELGGGIPRGLEGYVIVGVADPSVLGQVGSLLAMAGVKDFKPDGKFRSIDLGGMGMFSDLIKRPLKVAGRDDALVVAAGDRPRLTAEKAMAQTGGRSPLFMFAYDVGKVAKATSGVFDMIGGSGAGTMTDDPLGRLGALYGKEMLEAEARLFGLVVFSGHATDRGLGLVGRMDLR